MKTFLLLFIISIGSATISWLYFFDIFTFIVNITEAVNRPIVMSFSPYTFSTVMLVLPLIYYLFLRNKNFTSKSIAFIFLFNLISWLCLLLLIFVLVDKFNNSTNPFIPSYVVLEPFKHFWEIAFVISWAISFFITTYFSDTLSRFDRTTIT